MNAEILKALGVIIGGIVATVTPYTVTWLRKRFAKADEAKSFIHNTEHRVKINEVLVELRAITGANRVAIVEYHNGSTAINGLPFNYASMTYEKTDQTTREMLMNFQKIPISSISELLLDVHAAENGVVKVNEEYKYKDVIEFHRYYGVETTYNFRIGNHIKYGTVHIMWINEDVSLSQDMLDEIHYKVMFINELMLQMKKY